MTRLLSSMAGIGCLLAVSATAYGQRDSNATPWKQINLVRLHAQVAQAHAVGVFAECNDKLAPEECTFTVGGVRYTMGGTAASATATKFDALCLDIGFPDGTADDTWNCSPVGIDGLGVSVDASAGGSVVANGGINIGTTSAVGSNGQVQLGLGMALPITQRLEVPMAMHTRNGRPSVRLGGNILMESGIGPVSAGQTVVFSHTPFDGVVTFMVTRPAAMSLSIGYVTADGHVRCTRSGETRAMCPPALANALLSACELSTGGPCGAEPSEGMPPLTSFGPAIDTGELRASLDKLQPTISTVNADLQNELPDKLDEVFGLLDADEDDGDGGSTAALPRLRVFQRVKTHFQTKVLPKLEEIKKTVKENVLCPS